MFIMERIFNNYFAPSKTNSAVPLKLSKKNRFSSTIILPSMVPEFSNSSQQNFYNSTKSIPKNFSKIKEKSLNLVKPKLFELNSHSGRSQNLSFNKTHQSFHTSESQKPSISLKTIDLVKNEKNLSNACKNDSKLRIFRKNSLINFITEFPEFKTGESATKMFLVSKPLTCRKKTGKKEINFKNQKVNEFIHRFQIKKTVFMSPRVRLGANGWMLTKKKIKD